jgi:hypothetical protein
VKKLDSLLAKCFAMIAIGLLPLYVSGCFSMMAIQDHSRSVSDTIHRVEGAGIGNGKLVVLFEATTAESYRKGWYTITIPLDKYVAEGGMATNSSLTSHPALEKRGETIVLSRSVLASAKDPKLALKNLTPVPVCPSVSVDFSDSRRALSTIQPPAGFESSVFSFYQCRSWSLAYLNSKPLNNDRNYLLFKLPDSRSGSNPFRFLWLPLTIPIDIATSPFQLPVFIMLLNYHGC